jgi:hypothetical protein
MKRIICVVAVIALLAVMGGLVGCSSQEQNPQSGQGQPPASAITPSAQVSAGGQPAQGGGQPGQGGSQPGGAGGPGSSGTVKSVSGNTIVLTAQDNSTLTVKMDDKTSIQKNVAGTLADIQTGVRLVVMGDQSSGTITARTIQIGVGGAPSAMPPGQGGGQPSQGGPQSAPGAGQPGQSGGQPGPQGTPRAGQPGQGGGQPSGAGMPSMGTVKSVSGNTIVLTGFDNNTLTVQVDAKTAIQKTATGTAADIQAGVQIMVVGDTSNGTLTARMIQIGVGK